MELKVAKEKTDQVFVELPFKVYSEPAERLTTDHVIRNKDIATKGSQIVPAFDEMKNAMVSLQQRIQLLIEYLNAVESKKVAPNREVLELIQGVTNRLPTMSSEKFSDDFSTVLFLEKMIYIYIHISKICIGIFLFVCDIKELSTGMIMTYLAAMTKAAAKVNDTFDLFELTSDGRGGRSRGMRRFG
ncbi:COP9 signalosome, subunit CSN6 [Reticulomyxa filosa]|uniref:COP9 signalosome, subunit CSN6 n=1 Tax=Reticulomyxa filosa TaxID=46433 RepID=X6NSA2_RETFI|nr:COP9 signalosome, subunit CSN6 [Reticulomyxa filosa]|eukprot:ETO28614.1 COP9 signalosome, subunit CSN6 [Reticulomyxa filosa]